MKAISSIFLLIAVDHAFLDRQIKCVLFLILLLDLRTVERKIEIVMIFHFFAIRSMSDVFH